VHGVLGRIDAVDLGDPEVDALMKLRAARSDDVLRIGETEGHEQQARLVDVTIVAVDHHSRAADCGLIQGRTTGAIRAPDGQAGMTGAPGTVGGVEVVVDLPGTFL
jgi:hypothetical protein